MDVQTKRTSRRRRSAASTAIGVVFLICTVLPAYFPARILVAAEATTPPITQSIPRSPTRTWTDITGRFQVRGRLVGLGPDHVRIAKTNGRFSTVPVERLSGRDQQIIARVRSVVGFRYKPWITEVPEGYLPKEVVYVSVAKPLLSKLAQRPFQRTQPVSETILGYPVYGRARITAKTDIELVPDEDKAIIVIPINGVVRSATITDAGQAGVQVHGDSITRFRRTIRITLDDEGLEIKPQRLQSRSGRVITGITTPMPGLLGQIVRQMAHRQAEAAKPEFEQVADEITNRRINQEIDSKVNQALKLVERFVSSSVGTFEKVPESLRLRPRFQTAGDRFHLFLSQHVEKRYVSTFDPRPKPKEAPFVAQIHSSLIRKALTEREIIEMVKPLREQFRSHDGPAANLIKKAIAEGSYKTEWTTDMSWVSVYWYPASEVKDTKED